MIGTIVNCLSIIAGSLVGFCFKNGIPEKYSTTIMHAVALAVVLVGIKTALGCDDLLMVIISLASGSLIGELVGIEAYLERLGNYLQERFSKNSSTFSTGFVTASLLFCVGSMAVVGSLESGFSGNHATLFAKSSLDGITSIILTASLGIGVVLSAVPVLIYQGGITLMAGVLKPMLTPEVVSQMSGAGGLLIVAIGLNMLREKKIKVGNMLPAIFIPMLYYFSIHFLYPLLS